MADFDSDEIGPTCASTRRESGWSASDRLKLLHYVRDLTADTFGGWIAVTESLAGGGQYAQRLVTLRHYDLNMAKSLARKASDSRPVTTCGRERRDHGRPSTGVAARRFARCGSKVIASRTSRRIHSSRSRLGWVASTYDRHAGGLNPMFWIPTTEAELREQVEFLLAADRTAATTAGCFALTTLSPAVRSYADALVERDARVAAAVNDTAKPVRVVSRDAKGITITGGKQHVLGAAVVHEVVVVPAGRADDPIAPSHARSRSTHPAFG
jgi:hypothetical protein